MARSDLKLERSDALSTQEKIIELMSNNVVLSKREIIAKMEGKAGETTVIRHLKKLEGNESLRRISVKDLPKYGRYDIKDNQVYYILPSKDFTGDYNREIKKALLSGDAIKRKNALMELEELRIIPFQKDELFELSQILKNDLVLAEADQIIRIIHENFMNGLFPEKIKLFEKILIHYYNKHHHEFGKENNLRQGILQILALLDNPIIIDFFERDVKEGKFLSRINADYMGWMFKKIFNNNKIKLFQLSNEVQTQEQRDVIFNLRKKLDKATTYEQKIKPFLQIQQEVKKQ